MKLHNRFDIKQGGLVASFCNTVTNVGQFLKENRAYAQYMVLEGGGEKVVKKTVLLKKTNSEESGIISASYKVELSENECEGFCIEKIGFSPFEDGRQTANVAECSGLIKEFGSALVVVGTLYLGSSGNVRFVSGENPLVAFFLGQEELNAASFYALPYPKPMPSPLDPFSDSDAGESGATPLSTGLPAGAVLMNVETTVSGLRLDCGQMRNGENGICIFMDETPVLYVPLIASYHTREILPDLIAGGTVIAGGNLCEIEQAFVSNTPVSGGRTLRQVTGFEEIRETPLKVGKKGYFLTEPDGRYFAAVDERTVTIFDGETMRLVRNCKNYISGLLSDGVETAPNKRRIMLLEDGGVAFFGDSLIIEQADGKRAEYPVYCQSQGAISTCKEGYYVCVDSGGHTVRYLIRRGEEGGRLETLGIKKSGGRLCIFRMGSAIVVVDESQIEIGCASERDKAAENVLFDFVQNNQGVCFAGEEGVIRSEDGKACNLLLNSVFDTNPGDYLANGALVRPLEYSTVLYGFEIGEGLSYLETIEETFSDVVFLRRSIILKTGEGILKTAKLTLGETYYHHGDFLDSPCKLLVRSGEANWMGNLKVNIDFC